MRNKKLFIGFILAIIVLLFVEVYIYLNYNRLQKNDIKICFIVTGDNLDNWENMKAGAETAAMDEDCIIDFVNCPTEYGIEGEIDTLNKKFSEGFDYVALASSDYDTMSKYVSFKQYSNKVIFVKNGINDGNVRSVMTDDFQLGVEFSDYIIENSNAKKLLMVTTDENINNLEMMKGIYQQFEDSGIDLDYRLLTTTTGTLNKSMYNLGQSGLFDGFITLDTPTLEAAIKAQEKLSKKVLVYSIDNSSQAVYGLDSNALTAIAFKDDYSMGFLAVKEVLENKNYNQLMIDNCLYYISDKDSIHSEKMEKVLFPFVK